MVDFEAVKNKLKDKGYKLTHQRRAVLEILQENQDEHLTTEDVYMRVKSKCPEIGLATVYRTLQLLEKLDIIERLNFDDGYSRYELADDDDHHHLICIKCGEVLEVEEDLLEGLEKEIEKKNRFTILEHRLKFFGYCEKCASE